MNTYWRTSARPTGANSNCCSTAPATRRLTTARCAPRATARADAQLASRALRSVAVLAVVVFGVGGAGHRAEHGRPAGLDEPDPEHRCQHEEGNVQPGGVVPRDACFHHRGVAL